MEKEARSRFTRVILREAMKRFDVSPGAIRPLRSFQNFVYEFERDSASYILRIGHSLRRSEALVQAEVDWVNHLLTGGVSAGRPIRSANGRFVEAVVDGHGGHFLAVAFVKASGHEASEGDWTAQFFEQYGQLIGSMHALARTYRPVHPARQRHDWSDAGTSVAKHTLPEPEATKYRTVCDYLSRLPKDSESYGLIHHDAHVKNVLVDVSGRLTIVDFDNCVYSWFVNDIAIALFYMASFARDPRGFASECLPHFLRGYRQANKLHPRWLNEIPHFLKLRELAMYAVILQGRETGRINDWCADYLREHKTRIEYDVPYIEFDFQSLAPCLG